MSYKKFQQRWFLLYVMALALRTDSVCFCQKLGELRLEGQYIEWLVLKRKDGNTEQFNRPDETIRLPVGEYRLQDVRLKDGFNYSPRSTLKSEWVTVKEGEPAAFKVGAPLQQTVTIERQGPVLAFNYELTGVGGESYAGMRSKQPKFTVFKGDREVDCGEFEFS